MNSGARSWIPWLAAAGAGSLTAVQSRANGSLGTILDSGLHASVVSFAVGLTVLTLVGLAVRRIRLGMVRLLAALRSGAMPWWWAMGGVFGALFIFSQSFAVGTIGVALFAVALVSGQNLASLIVDAVGLGPRGRQPVSVVRMASSMIGIVAVGIAVSGRVREDSVSVRRGALRRRRHRRCHSAGDQRAINSDFSRTDGCRLGELRCRQFHLTFALLMIIAIGARALEALPAGPWWLYLGGVIGATFIATTAWVVGKVGVLAISLLVTAGQLTGALVLDVVILDFVDGPLIAGALLSFGAVALTAVGSSRNRSSITPDTP